jgi:hypothetical protein
MSQRVVWKVIHGKLLACYYPSPKRILKAIEGKKHRTPLRKKFEIGMTTK